MGKEIKLSLDDKSVEILEQMDALHRQTFINYCIRIGKMSELYGVILGDDAVIETLETSSINTNEEKVVQSETVAEPENDFSIKW